MKNNIVLRGELTKRLVYVLFFILLPVSLFAAENKNDAETNVEWINYTVLGFGVLVILGELFLIKKMTARWTPYSVIRLIGITLIIISALALVIGSGEENQVSAVVGLLGTLAGYLLGKDAKEEDFIPKTDQQIAENAEPSSVNQPNLETDKDESGNVSDK